MPTVLTPADFINRFNLLVYTPITTAYPAVTSTVAQVETFLPPLVLPEVWVRNFNDVDTPVEPVFTAAMLPPSFASEGALNAAFHLMHRFAMRLTRIRMARHFYAYTTNVPAFAINEMPPTRTALNNNLALFFDRPAFFFPAVGDTITFTELDNFLNQMRLAVEERRTQMQYAHVTLTSCHSSCHGACHGSRSRR